MILMWLGSFVLMLFGLSESQKHLSRLLRGLQVGFLNKGFDAPFVKMLIRALDVVVLEASPQKSLYSGMALFNLRLVSLRPAVLIMCLSILGAWWLLLLGLLFLSFNGFFLLGLCLLGFINTAQMPKLKGMLQLIFAVGIFLIGGEMMLRNSSVIQTLLGQSELAFVMADGRFAAVFGILACSILLSLLVQVEFWTMALGLSLLVTNVVSFNGALALVAGERIGRMILFWWHCRSLSEDCRKLGRQLSLASIFGVCAGFFLAGEVRSLFYFSFSSDLSSLQDKSLQFILMLGLILLGQFVLQMLWGHFASQRPSEDLPRAQYFSVLWIQSDLLSLGVWQWAQDKVQKRINEMRYHLQGLKSLPEGQIPEPLLARLKQEEAQLSNLMSRIEPL